LPEASHLLFVRLAIMISSKTSLFWQHLWIATLATPPQPMISALPICLFLPFAAPAAMSYLF
jgi:hypothetical protein